MRAKLTYYFAQSALNLHDNLVPNSKTLFLFSPDKQFKLPLMSVPPCTFALFYNIMFSYKWHAGNRYHQLVGARRPRTHQKNEFSHAQLLINYECNQRAFSYLQPPVYFFFILQTCITAVSEMLVSALECKKCCYCSAAAQTVG